MAQQRDDEAAVIAQICSKLIRAMEIEDEHTRRPRPPRYGRYPTPGSNLWRYERALEARGPAVASQAGKTLFLQQETQDVLALSRARIRATGLHLEPSCAERWSTDEELLDIAEEVHQAGPKASPQACSTSRRAPGIPWRRPLRP
ncbi:hypothetical protein [Sinorhizobium saheli]|uniref:Uncharacterized protein n=1 Tax=Sinorhizobium saheli TaxID=36856 RepID=A0A178YRG3_SINSA|nr:hypothetical protein [Sinorhizobium saheli]MQW90720.1 hypothetical protein [Sinorhizobium saheli]OAP49796.1 hypothetical protein ATB98_03240 [Sinorhizobium saheli]